MPAYPALRSFGDHREVPLSIRLAAGRMVAAAALPLALLPFVAVQPAAAKSASIDYPRQGVVCDRATKMCFDSTGVSVTLTREYFGRSAERELIRKLSGSNRPTQFQLSNGDVCDVRRQTCWDDGWDGKNISRALSKQLFGNNGAWRNPGSGNTSNNWNNNSGWNNSGGGGWNNNSGNNGSWNNGNNWNNNNWQQGQGNTACELRQGNRRLFNGSCVLNRRESSNGMAYNVELGDGRRYSFFNRQGNLVLRDATGVWPVQVSNSNGNVSFRWADLRLEAQDSRWNNQGQQGGFEDVNPTGVFLQNLFNNLFR
ncbi:MAG: hypothetical protein DCF18_14340 [Cyanobium sp.]|nr:MAG: hypothetical protein DCF18_14340 [Cyanobium sp.]